MKKDLSIDNDKLMSKKKPNFPIIPDLRGYLEEYERENKIPVSYKDLIRYTSAFPLYDKHGEDTLWESMLYDSEQMKELNEGLTKIYALLRTAGDISVMEHLFVDRIDYCSFGNSNPFRIRIVNKLNDNHDYFYVKKADASRIYGLELEHILSPNRINYLVDNQTLIEEHIAGIPGDQFIKHNLFQETTNKVRIAKEFVKFNERCFVRLLGDMRSYNYVIDVTPDFDEEQYRIRAIDFDQQSYEGRRSLYLPQYFKDNNPIVELCIRLMTMETFRQYQQEERTLIARRVNSSKYKLKHLIDCMRIDKISSLEKVENLKQELAKHHNSKDFDQCDNMGDVVRMNLKVSLGAVI
ncbi:MAG: hypothetical protein MRY83_06755 [Flavobacteriales bacterium]|nr:hypothetical protein [Flavobacteriales bacterium]